MRLQAAANESEEARLAADRERAKAEGKLRQMQALVCPSRPLSPFADWQQVEGTDFEKATVKTSRSNVDIEKERARYQKDLRDFEYTISQTRSKYQSESGF